MLITVAYITHREDPKFEWFAAGLARELRAWPSVQAKVVVVDGQLWSARAQERREAITQIVAGRFSYLHVPPKPCVLQGPHRLTRRDFFAAGNMRNTAIALSEGAYVAFADDLSVLRPGWMAGHVQAATEGFTVAGSTDKIKHIEVDAEGNVVRFDPHPPGCDSRVGHVRNGPCPGSILYGGCFGVPLRWAIAVNGVDEICDGIGGEDYDFGIRLQRAGCSVRFNSTCATYEDEDLHHTQAVTVRLDKPMKTDGPYSSNTLLNRLLREQTRSHPLGNRFNLGQMRDHVLAGGAFPVPTEPTHDWRDGQPLAEM